MITMRSSTSLRLPFQPHRFAVDLPGRLLVNGEVEQSCVLDVVDGWEACFTTNMSGDVGIRGRAVCYLDLVGRLEGPAVRSGPNNLIVTLSVPETKWARLRQQFALLASTSAADRDNLRGHRRIIPDVVAVEILPQNGSLAAGVIRDVSRSGAAIEASTTVKMGDRITLGTTRGHVTRSFSGGFAVQFARLLPLERFGTSYKL